MSSAKQRTYVKRRNKDNVRRCNRGYGIVTTIFLHQQSSASGISREKCNDINDELLENIFAYFMSSLYDFLETILLRITLLNNE